jgi:hypothetical protein
MQTHLSNPAASLLLADIGTMLHFVEPDTYVGFCVKSALEARMSVKQIVDELAEQIRDNRLAASRCIGIRLVEKIEKYKMINV